MEYTFSLNYAPTAERTHFLSQYLMLIIRVVLYLPIKKPLEDGESGIII